MSEEPGDAKVKLTKADRLEAKAARVREAEERRTARAAEAAATGERGPAPRGLMIATVVLGVVTAALVALLVVGFFSWQHRGDVSQRYRALWHQQQTSADTLRATDALQAAKTFAVDFGSYDYRHLDTEFSEVASRMTPDFAKNYLETSDKLKPTFVQYKTQVVARIQGYGVTSASASSATIVIFLDQAVRTSQSSTPRIDRNRLELHMVKAKGKWLVQKLLAK